MEKIDRQLALKINDDEVIERVMKGEKEVYEVIMRKYNQRLFRITRSYLQDEDEIEDVIQETYVKAYEQLPRFEKRAQFSTWLTRIAINEALARVKKQKRFTSLSSSSDEEGGYHHVPELRTPEKENPADKLMNNELKNILESAVDRLPVKYRSVYMMREIEGMSVAETSECLDISQANVKVRLNRAKEMLRESITTLYGGAEAFQFNLVRCDRIVQGVLGRITRY